MVANRTASTHISRSWWTASSMCPFRCLCVRDAGPRSSNNHCQSIQFLTVSTTEKSVLQVQLLMLILSQWSDSLCSSVLFMLWVQSNKYSLILSNCQSAWFGFNLMGNPARMDRSGESVERLQLPSVMGELVLSQVHTSANISLSLSPFLCQCFTTEALYTIWWLPVCAQE